MIMYFYQTNEPLQEYRYSLFVIPLATAYTCLCLSWLFLDQGCFKAKNCVYMSAVVKRISASALYLVFFCIVPYCLICTSYNG